MPRLLSRPTTRRRGLRFARPVLRKPLLGEVLVIFPRLCVALLSRPSSLANGLLGVPGLLGVVLAILRGLFAVPLSRPSNLASGWPVFFSALVLMVLLIVVLLFIGLDPRRRSPDRPAPVSSAGPSYRSTGPRE